MIDPDVHRGVFWGIIYLVACTTDDDKRGGFFFNKHNRSFGVLSVWSVKASFFVRK